MPVRIAEWLAGHPRIAQINFPGLATHPQHELARRLFEGKGFGAVLSFQIAGADQQAAFRFMDALELCMPATTLGDIYTLVLHPASSSHRALSAAERAEIGISDGLVRLSVGIEDADDIIADLKQALRVGVLKGYNADVAGRCRRPLPVPFRCVCVREAYMSDDSTRPGLSRLATVFFAGCFVVITYFLYRVFAPFFSALLWAVVLTVVFLPLFKFVLARVRGRRTAAAIITCLLILLLIVLPVTFLGVLITQQSIALYQSIQGNTVFLGAVTERLQELQSRPAIQWLASQAQKWLGAG